MASSLPCPKLTEALAELDALTNWESRPRGGMRVGLDPMLDLMLRLGNPHATFRSIHVAGTKGKGSVCALTEAALVRAGWRVGRYASPHVEHVAERISLSGRMADSDELASMLFRAMDAYRAAKLAGTPGCDATWFDVMTAAAFLLFQEAGIDWAVVEVGIGGRLDSTNVVNAELAVVTNVELEHTEILGASRDLIAAEKVGILKPGAVLVTTLPSGDTAGRVLQARADQLGCRIVRGCLGRDSTIEARNAELVGIVLEELGGGGLRVGGESGPKPVVGSWLLDRNTREKARLPCRMERFDIDVAQPRRGEARTIAVVLDGAHIPFNLDAVLRDLSGQAELRAPCVAIVALAADKDAAGFLEVLSRHAATAIVTVIPGHGRSHSAAELNAIARSLGMSSEIEPDASVAYERGIQRASELGAWVLVTGSLYLVGALRGAASAAAKTQRL